METKISTKSLGGFIKNNKFPTWDEAISGIEDNKFTDAAYSKAVRHYVEIGARIMYNRLYVMFSQNAVLTSKSSGQERAGDIWTNEDESAEIERQIIDDARR